MRLLQPLPHVTWEMMQLDTLSIRLEGHHVELQETLRCCLYLIVIKLKAFGDTCVIYLQATSGTSSLRDQFGRTAKLVPPSCGCLHPHCILI